MKLQTFFFIGAIAKKSNRPFIVFAANWDVAEKKAKEILAAKDFGIAETLSPESAWLIADYNCSGKFQSYVAV